MRRRWLFALALLFVLVIASRLASQDVRDDPNAEPTIEQLEARVHELLGAADGREHAETVIDQARLAVERARVLEASQKTAEATRAKQIAWAAIALASRRIALGRERVALRAATRRAAELERESTNLRERLEAALAERARARETAFEPIVLDAGVDAAPDAAQPEAHP